MEISKILDFDYNNNYQSIIEQNRQVIRNGKYDYNNLIGIVKKFTIELKEPLFISLSGGVDSMVLLVILKIFLNKNVVAIHINYNNREECNLEQKFLELFCKKINVKLFSKKMHFRRCEIDRKEYEILAKKERFTFYLNIINNYFANINDSGIFLAHHADDSVENIFNNIMNNKSLMDLAVIKDSTNIMGINIFRPFVNIFKEEVYYFSNYFEVMYFNDTTPEWSTRGHFRNEIFPLVEKYYTCPKSNLIQVSQQISEWGSCIQELIINPIIKDDIKISINDGTFEYCFINYDKLINCPISIWIEILKYIFHKIGYNCPSKKSINILISKCLQYKQYKEKANVNVILMKIFIVNISDIIVIKKKES